MGETYQVYQKKNLYRLQEPRFGGTGVTSSIPGSGSDRESEGWFFPIVSPGSRFVEFGR